MTDSIVDFEKQLTPYYDQRHEEYRLHVRKFRETYIDPYIQQWIKKGEHPNIREFIAQQIKFGGIYLFPYSYGSWKGYEWDPFFLIVFTQELNKYAWSAGEGIISMSLGPLERFASNDIQKNILNECKNGTKLIALAISELNGGSDVSRIKTSAVKTSDGKHYIVNGTKYWITTGHRADYFVTLVRTSNEGRFGVSLLLIPREQENGVVITEKIKLQGDEGNDTAQVNFINVKVPISHLLYKENKGFIPLMTNFNRERFIICCGLVQLCRLCIDESINWSKERKTFGKYLIQHQVIRHKIANMSRRTLACQSFLERVAYQMKFDPYGAKDKSLARNVALLKVQCSKTCQYCSIEASQIFGGRSYVRGGRGGIIERIYRSVRAQAIAGGSEEILLDLAMRQAKL